MAVALPPWVAHLPSMGERALLPQQGTIDLGADRQRHGTGLADVDGSELDQTRDNSDSIRRFRNPIRYVEPRPMLDSRPQFLSACVDIKNPIIGLNI